jgi:hypothetical protein
VMAVSDCIFQAESNSRAWIVRAGGVDVSRPALFVIENCVFQGVLPSSADFSGVSNTVGTTATSPCPTRSGSLSRTRSPARSRSVSKSYSPPPSPPKTPILTSCPSDPMFCIRLTVALSRVTSGNTFAPVRRFSFRFRVHGIARVR